MFNNLFDSMLYVKIYKNKIVVKNLSNNLSPQMFTPDIAFTTTRLLIGTFAPAVQCLKQAVRNSTPNSWFKAKPILLIHPMEMHEGGLSEIEDKVLHECALAAGARKVVLWLGAELSNDKAIEKINSSR
jgi:rod shape-determining protein MreB and related proteins